MDCGHIPIGSAEPAKEQCQNWRKVLFAAALYLSRLLDKNRFRHNSFEYIAKFLKTLLTSSLRVTPVLIRPSGELMLVVLAQPHTERKQRFAGQKETPH
jgi:hypothetical protein